jgi:hypothetical protein
MTTGWARAFLKLWVVSAVIWMAAVVVVALHDPRIPSLTNSCAALLDPGAQGTAKSRNQAQVAQCELDWRQGRAELLGWILIPPASAGVVVLTLVWAMRAFRAGPGNW